jgi:hypothetical protein
MGAAFTRHALNGAVAVTSAVLIGTKYLDCSTTARALHAAGDKTHSLERNPLARHLMQSFGAATTIWGIFAFVALIVTGCSWWVWLPDPHYSQPSEAHAHPYLLSVCYVLVAAFAGLVQTAVVYSNYALLQRRRKQPQPQWVTAVISRVQRVYEWDWKSPTVWVPFAAVVVGWCVLAWILDLSLLVPLFILI